MKKFLLGIGLFALAAAVPLAVVAKSPDNNAGAKTYGWNLSGAVMPVPPYGSSDIIGSDTASKLIVNQPNGAVKATITGVMNGLNPNTTYTVFISNAWVTSHGWDVTGEWDANFVATTGAIGTYPHHMDLTQTGGTLTGSGYYIPAPLYTWVIDSGSVTGNRVVFDLHYTGGHPTTWTTHVDAYVQNDGSLLGHWSDNQGNSGDVTSYSGHAANVLIGGWSGLFNTQKTFTFTTDENGSGSWHVNLKDVDFSDLTSPYNLSVWINGGGATILVSNNFTVK